MRYATRRYCRIVDPSYRRGKAVADSGNRNDHTLLVVPERLTQQRDVSGQAGVLDEAVGPYPSNQLVLADDFTGVLDENEERVQDLRRQCDGFVVSRQQSAVCGQTKVLEDVS